jgi:hypothetical protein
VPLVSVLHEEEGVAKERERVYADDNLSDIIIIKDLQKHYSSNGKKSILPWSTALEAIIHCKIPFFEPVQALNVRMSIWIQAVFGKGSPTLEVAKFYISI